MYGNYRYREKVAYKRIYELSLKMAINIYQRAFNQMAQGIFASAIKDDSLSFSNGCLSMLEERIADYDFFEKDEEALKENVLVARNNIQNRLSTLKDVLALYDAHKSANKWKDEPITSYLNLMDFYEDYDEEL